MISLNMLKQKNAIVVATSNVGKVKEIKAILGPVLPDATFYALGEIDLGYYEEPEETGKSFAENARIKAEAATRALGLRAIADDSGLCVDALYGAPGIFSARWAGAHGDDEANNIKLLEELRKMGAKDSKDRKAHFVSSVAMVFPDGSALSAEGRCEGTIAYEATGENGFGYDPIFLADALGGDTTMAQISAEEKNEISHRSQALHALAEELRYHFDKNRIKEKADRRKNG